MQVSVKVLRLSVFQLRQVEFFRFLSSRSFWNMLPEPLIEEWI